MPDSVSRELVRAILETRDRRHNETHGAIVTLWQQLVVELVQSGSLSAPALANRLDEAHHDVAPDANGDGARHLLETMAGWVRTATPPEKPRLLSKRWFALGVEARDENEPATPA